MELKGAYFFFISIFLFSLDPWCWTCTHKIYTLLYKCHGYTWTSILDQFLCVKYCFNFVFSFIFKKKCCKLLHKVSCRYNCLEILWSSTSSQSRDCLFGQRNAVKFYQSFSFRLSTAYLTETAFSFLFTSFSTRKQWKFLLATIKYFIRYNLLKYQIFLKTNRKFLYSASLLFFYHEISNTIASINR